MNNGLTLPHNVLYQKHRNISKYMCTFHENKAIQRYYLIVIKEVLQQILQCAEITNTRVAKCACPRVLDDQKMNEDNQKLRCGCPPEYQIFGVKII